MAVPWPEIAAHRERLVRIARRRCPTREDAEDVVHEAMLRSATFAELDEARLGQFLTAVTLRLCADVHRGAERFARAARRLDLDDVPTPEDAACEAAEAEELRALLASLPERQRAVLVDRAHGLSVSQISNRHALTYKATESALSRARSAMRLALASAMSAVAAGLVTLRRRPAAALALPLVAVAAVTTAHVAPEHFGDGGRRTPPRAAVPVSPRTETVAGAGAQAAPAAARAPRVAPRRAPRQAALVRGAQQEKVERSIVRVNPVPAVDTEVKTDDDNLTSGVERCVKSDEVKVTVKLDADGPELYAVDSSCESRNQSPRGVK